MSHPVFERILVTGGTGFIGRHMVRRLLSDGHRPLVSVSNGENSVQILPAGIDTVELDVTDAAQVQRLVNSYRPSFVIHLAGTTGHNDPNGEKCRSMNLEATITLVDALCETDLKRLVLIGSAAEYGNQPVPFREDMQLLPSSHYGRSKAEANLYALGKWSTTGFPVTVLRVFTAFGIGQPQKMFLSQLISNAVSNTPFEMSDGLQKRDFVYIDDVVDAIVRSLDTEAAIGKSINIGSGHGIRLRDLARAVWAACGSDPDVLRIGARPKSGDEAFDTEADIQLAEQILAWKPGAQIVGDNKPGSVLSKVISGMKSQQAGT